MSGIQNMAALMFKPPFVFRRMLFAKFTQALAAFGRGIRCEVLGKFPVPGRPTNLV